MHIFYQLYIELRWLKLISNSFRTWTNISVKLIGFYHATGSCLIQKIKNDELKNVLRISTLGIIVSETVAAVCICSKICNQNFFENNKSVVGFVVGHGWFGHRLEMQFLVSVVKMKFYERNSYENWCMSRKLLLIQNMELLVYTGDGQKHYFCISL